tara:strand:+ start:1158 stop:2231 length:1074 start_codon:yes stop_codon:yes gene_type:complete
MEGHTVNGRLLNGAECRALAARALELMETHAVPPSPENYAIWSSYASDHNGELCETLDRMIESGEPFTAATNDKLYDKFFSQKIIEDLLLNSSGVMTKELGNVSMSLAAATRDTAAYGETLAGAEGELANASDPETMRRMIQDLVDATSKMQTRSRTLERRLHETSTEVTQLRTNLERVREEAMTDALTGVANRKRFDEKLRKGRRAADENNEEFCLILCDIDHFKRFNDTWGHQTGDQIIRFVSGCMTRHAKDNHTVARYGGEEFGVVMPNTSLEEATKLAETIRHTVESKKLLRKSTNEDLGNITISIGVAKYRKGEAIEALIERSDTNLYKSKQNGRNRVSVETADEDTNSVAA